MQLQPKSSDASHERRRVNKVPHWKRWYDTARWKQLREDVLKRDDYICQATGVLLVGGLNTWNSPIADHKVPHRGDPELFWDPDNVWAVCKRWHDSEKQRLEKRGLV
ncbi:HNH endonuclease [Terasakiella pusilla]|uniref:HNH endonuclease n=1 Tax=Terasakiella pusilla TaxID=64973 RepID=UPI003AA7EC00